jgi:BRCT domain type II-containing protein
MDLKDVKNWYAANLKGNAGRYMKTSSLIITYADLLTTGGHNLSSRISRVNSMTNYKRNRGNYTPKDYESPSQPVATEAKPVPTAPRTTGKPAGKPTSKPAVKSSGNRKPASTASSSKPASKNIRPRGSVISSAPRRTRGL